MRANTDETLKRGSVLRETHGSWVKVSRLYREAEHRSSGTAENESREIGVLTDSE